MSRPKDKKPGLKAHLKRKREPEESADVDDKPATRPLLQAKRAKRSQSIQQLAEQPASDAEPKHQPAHNSETAKQSHKAASAKTAKSPREHPSAQDAVGDPALLADRLAKYIQKYCPNSSPIELEEQYLPAKAFLDTTGYDRDRVAANLPQFIERFSPEGKTGLSTCDEKASPHTLVVTSSGIRTADLYRELRVFQNAETKVGKLIAKHMKLRDNIEYMLGNKIGIAISTPFRFKQLVDADALKTEKLRRIVVDGSYCDEKNNTIFMMAQTFNPLVTLLNEKSIRQRYGDGKDNIEILVF
ncbi:Protein cms1 [Cladophialophora carrionii]|uniref:Protein cms1 n=1 Tax=Cladophialophora carrionii TaxID=86049 RepID=A0A1C1D2Z9_9EURO|nr:Protein cms1 [Cladophialophora carrionii]